MIRLVFDPARFSDHRARLTAAESHYLFDVMRKTPGDLMEALLPERGVFLAHLADDAVILDERLEVASSNWPLYLYQALIKQDRFAEVVGTGTQVGITHFIPVVTARTVVRTVPDNRYTRWAAIAREATEQCKRPDVPRILPLCSLNAVDVPDAGTGIVLDPGGEPLAAWVARALPHLGGVAVVVGPEGGLASAEIEQLAQRRFFPVNIGPFVLRAENAGVMAAALLRYALDCPEIAPSSSTPGGEC